MSVLQKCLFTILALLSQEKKKAFNKGIHLHLSIKTFFSSSVPLLETHRWQHQQKQIHTSSKRRLKGSSVWCCSHYLFSYKMLTSHSRAASLSRGQFSLHYFTDCIIMHGLQRFREKLECKQFYPSTHYQSKQTEWMGNEQHWTVTSLLMQTLHL